MLETLRGREVSDVVAVVSRWFGGTLLGVGGLVRAYSEAVALALDEAGVLRRERREVVEVDAGHAEAGRLEHELRARGVVVRDASYGALVTLTLAVPPGLGETLPGTLAELTGGAASPRHVGTDWVDLPPA
jgi:putative IMPACT (imprinted ancient) family translation regulator